MENPCINCVDDSTCGEACRKYVYFLSQVTGEQVSQVAKESADLIRQASREDDD